MNQDRRRYPRLKAPKTMLVAWQAGSQRGVSRVETLGLGGLFLYAPEAPPVGTTIELVFDGVRGAEVRARAVVRRTKPGEGMGVEFVYLRPEDRARLTQLLNQLQVVERGGEQGPSLARPVPTRWFTPDSRSLDSGEIRDHHALFTLLNRIYSARLTGVLQLVLGRVEKQLYFNGGQVIFARSNVPQDGLGEVMLLAGALTQPQFEEASARMGSGQLFGSALIDLGICNVAQLTEWVRRQVTQIAASTLDHSAGRYYFFGSFEKHVVPEIGISLPLGRLLVDAVRKADNLPLDELAHDQELCVNLSSDPVLRLQTVELNQTERAVLATIARPMSVTELIHMSRLPNADAARALYALLALGIIVAMSSDALAPQKPAAAISEPETLPPPASPSSDKSEDLVHFEEEMKRLLDLAERGTYYQLLGVTSNSSVGQVKHNFHQLARKFHPDRHMGCSEWIGLLQKLTGALAEAYNTLVDEQKRTKYDKRLAESGAFSLERGKTEMQQTTQECMNRAIECLRANNFAGSILWLRKCVRLAPEESKYRAMLARSLAAVPQYRHEAVGHFQEAIDLDPWNTSAYFQFAELYEEMQLPWRARPLYLKILEIDPAHSKARERLSLLDAKEGQKGGKSSSFISRLLSGH